MKPARLVWSVVAVVLLAGTVARAQSLADVAKKTEEERKKTPKTATKVYTNNDLKTYPAAPPADSASQPPGDASAAPAQPAPGDKDKPADETAKPAPPEDTKDEAYWKGLLNAAKAKLERDQAFRDALESRVNALTNDFYARDDPAQRSVIWTQRTKALEDMERVKKDIVDDNAAIVKIQDDARRAGVPPGWLR